MLLKLEDIKAELGVSMKTVYSLINEHGLDKYLSRIGGRYMITPERLKQYIDDKLIVKDA